MKTRLKLALMTGVGLLLSSGSASAASLYCFYHGGTWYCLPWWWIY